jgi:putative transposase
MARWTYNKCVAIAKERYAAYVKQESERTAGFIGGVYEAEEYLAPNAKECTQKFVNEAAFSAEEYLYVKKTPYDVRDEGKRDFFKALNSTIEAMKVVGFKKFDMHFRSKKAESESIVINAKHWKNGRIAYSAFGKELLRSAEPLPDDLIYDTRLVKKRSGRYYLCVLSPLEIRSENQAPVSGNRTIEDGILAIDPGVRTFAASYSPSGKTFEWGSKDIGRLYRLCLCMDKIQSKTTKKYVEHKNKASQYEWRTIPMRARLRYKMRRAMRRMRFKMRNLVDELHKKLVLWIVRHFKFVLYPDFSSKGMVQRIHRRIGSKTVRNMLTWSHGRFKQRLLNKTREHPWCNVIVCDEHYTSMTCGRCGFLHRKLGSNKTFACPRCHAVMDRDLNAARNILLRYVTLNREKLFSAGNEGKGPQPFLDPAWGLTHPK